MIGSPISRPLAGHLQLITALFFAFLAILIALPAAVFAQDDVCDGTLTKLSACHQKGSDNVVIGLSSQCKAVFVDQSFTGSNSLPKITISPGGALCIRDSDLTSGSLQIDTPEIVDLGTFEIGSSASPIGTRSINGAVTINFTGIRDVGPGRPSEKCPDPDFRKGIEVCQGATLRLFGVKGVPSLGSSRTDGTHTSWTYLSQPAGDPLKFGSAGTVGNVAAPVTEPDARTIDVADNVDWQPNDWIVIATTSFSPYESEFAQIATVTNNGSGAHITLLNNPLVFYHFGGPNPYAADGGAPGPNGYNGTSATNFGVDERAEVGLITRSIKLTATIPIDARSLHWGGEIIVRAGFKEVSIQGAELQKFGKDRLGSYPIHLHKDGVIDSDQTLLVNANSIDHSYNKCITVHSTAGASAAATIPIINNVCARVVGHLFYEEVGDEQNITFGNNLGLGAMSNSFDINNGTGTPSSTLITQYWWPGDHLVSTASFNYDGFRIPDTDNQQNGAAGQCFNFNSDKNANVNSALVPANPSPPPCGTDAIYAEPPTGFWIVNPSAILTGNSIGGCQGKGKGYWYVPPARPQGDTGKNYQTAKFIPVGSYPGLTGLHGQFTNNRVHGCYSGLYSGDSEDITAGAPTPYQNGVKSPTSHPVMSEFDGLTATRNRNRGAWVRPTFDTLRYARFATNLDSVSLVTSGGPDGNYPGIYSLLSNSVLAGVSQNNVDRWGPCPLLILGNGTTTPGGQVRGSSWGCIDQTSALRGQHGAGGDLIGNGYPSNGTNFEGDMIYDGPVLIFNDRFVNFKQNPASLLTTVDAAYLNSNTTPPPTSPPPHGVYEGDAALGWYQGNISSYPTANTSEGLTFNNVDLRHQVYTQEVFLSSFNDGDKNTTILDRDATLSGHQVVSTADPSTVLTDVFPISLNNLELNAGGGLADGGPGGSVDECQATGAQDVLKEGRATANMSPGEVGALEFQTLYPTGTTNATRDRSDQLITFQKDSIEFGGSDFEEHPTMTLVGRNGQGVWEPKVTSGYGYTITASTATGITVPACPPGYYADNKCPKAGIPKRLNVGLVDTVKPRISSTNPFYVRVGICYTGANKSHPTDPSLFTITQGYRSWGGGDVEPTDPAVRSYYNKLDGESNGLKSDQYCFNLDHQNLKDLDHCPSVGVTPPITTSADGPVSDPSCPAAATYNSTQNLCLYPKQTLTAASAISGLTTNGTPNLNKYFYDPSTGWLFFYVAQIRPNATGPNGGPAPLGSCTGNTATDPFFCPSQNGGESYYVCPPEGCWDYSVALSDPRYSPEPSACGSPYPAYAQNTPVLEGQLAQATTPVTRLVGGGLTGQFPHYSDANLSSNIVCPSAPTPTP